MKQFCVLLLSLACLPLMAQENIVDRLEQPVLGQGVITIHQDARLDALLGTMYDPTTSKGKKIQTIGYRIQIYAGGNTRFAKEEAQKAANATSSRLIPIERYDINIVTGVLNTMAERDISTLHLGLHRRSRIIDTFLGSKIEQLLKSTNAMVVISRIFIPVNTLSRIVVVVPSKAQYEGGFRHWVEAVGNLTREVGCKVVFCGADETNRTIRSVLQTGRFGIRQEYVEISYDDDFVLLPNRIHEDDLLVVVSARRSSVSFSPSMDELPEFLQKYFSSNNLIILYPEHTGTANVIVPTMAETMTADISGAPSPIWLMMRRIYRRINPSGGPLRRKLKL